MLSLLSDPSRGKLVILVGTLICFVGCGETRPSGMPELHSVTVQFTQAGAPLSDAAIQLIPLDPSNTWTSGGGTDANGTCVVHTHGTYQGVPAGKYKICVSKTETEGKAGETDMANPGVPTASTLKTFSLVDQKYSVPEDTPLEIEVTGTADQRVTYELSEPTRTEVARPPS